MTTELHQVLVDLPYKLRLFCDIPFSHLWAQLLINQYGYVYHFNCENHLRIAYQAKTREMCLDVFSFDQARPLYDYLPFFELYGDDLKGVEKQIIIRTCMDIICKHSTQLFPQIYSGANMVCRGEKPWVVFPQLPARERISFE